MQNIQRLEVMRQMELADESCRKAEEEKKVQELEKREQEGELKQVMQQGKHLEPYVVCSFQAHNPLNIIGETILKGENTGLQAHNPLIEENEVPIELLNNIGEAILKGENTGIQMRMWLSITIDWCCAKGG